MVEKPSLAAALTQQSGRAAQAASAEQPNQTRQSLPPSRQGKKTIAGHFDPAVSRQLREIALAEDSSVQELLREALNDLFAKRGRPPIA
jgi:predicted HicB family RNase H-like nuclease